MTCGRFVAALYGEHSQGLTPCSSYESRLNSAVCIPWHHPTHCKSEENSEIMKTPNLFTSLVLLDSQKRQSSWIGHFPLKHRMSMTLPLGISWALFFFFMVFSPPSGCQWFPAFLTEPNWLKLMKIDWNWLNLSEKYRASIEVDWKSMRIWGKPFQSPEFCFGDFAWKVGRKNTHVFETHIQLATYPWTT